MAIGTYSPWVFLRKQAIEQTLDVTDTTKYKVGTVTFKNNTTFNLKLNGYFVFADMPLDIQGNNNIIYGVYESGTTKISVIQDLITYMEGDQLATYGNYNFIRIG